MLDWANLALTWPILAFNWLVQASSPQSTSVPFTFVLQIFLVPIVVFDVFCILPWSFNARTFFPLTLLGLLWSLIEILVDSRPTVDRQTVDRQTIDRQ